MLPTTLLFFISRKCDCGVFLFLLLIALCLMQPLCPKELWHFVHQCYGNELGLTSDDEDYVPPDDDFNTMGWVWLRCKISCYGCHNKHFSVYCLITQIAQWLEGLDMSCNKHYSYVYEHTHSFQLSHNQTLTIPLSSLLLYSIFFSSFIFPSCLKWTFLLYQEVTNFKCT